MTDISEDKLVVAPGGVRPASTVTHVQPGEAVEVGAAGPRVTPDLVLTPGGFKSRANVHLVAEGHSVAHVDRQVQLLDAKENVLARVDLKVVPEDLVTPAFGTGWITYSGWTNRTGTPISSFVTTWTVPRAPRTNHSQTIFLFNGIEPSDFSHILQPVLQWGPSAAGGGAYWTVASWYVGGGNAFHTNLIRVNEGDVLVGVMTLNSRSGNNFNYSSSFSGIANTTLNITNNPELTWASETLEAYGITACSDYPATDTTPMTQINVRAGTTAPALNWSVNNAIRDCGQKTVIALDGSTNGEVELSYRGEAGWARNDLTAAAGGAPLAAGDPAGYTWDVDKTQHNVYRGFDNHVHELWFNNAWHHNDLTAA
ncbi:MAG TPA: hypothetical protein VGR06_03745, partial [Actinophytocola sp.]|uniref:hypothetical protein n=1 Tax=Actinophytocola sp. TaxID=1872138 RepID=UPI002DFE30BF|nr:hypothetical protein [Actinophytocola sp.]